MNNASILEIEKARMTFLEKYGLSDLEREAYQQKRKVVEPEEADKIGKQLYDYISKKTYSDSATEEVDKLILEGANLEYQTPKKGDTLLLLCSRRGYINSFVLLARAGADINHGSLYKTTPTMTSARHGNREMLEILVALKADINAQCLDGDTALMSAKRHDQKECFEILKRANANFGIRNLQNQTVMEIPSQERFDYTEFKSFEEFLDRETTEESVDELLREATEKMQEITTAIPEAKTLVKNNQSNTFKRIR